MSKASPSNPRIPFFALNATYSIDPDASVCDLLEDLSCLLGAGINTLLDNDTERLTQTQWCAVYAVQQASAILEHVSHQVGQRFAKGDAV